MDFEAMVPDRIEPNILSKEENSNAAKYETQTYVNEGLPFYS